jgi:hypothetical protein
MSETRISQNETYEQSITPKVFKKIDTSDISFTPFKAHKVFTVYSGSNTSSCLPLNAVYSDLNILPALGTELIYNDSKNIDDSLQTVTYYSINHLFYKHKYNAFNSIGGLTNNNLSSKYLYQSASILSFPYLKIGDGLKSKSFELTTVTNSIAISLKSDRYGNIYDSGISSGSFINNVMFYEGFNEYFDTNRLSTSDDLVSMTTTHDRYITGSINFVNGVNATSGVQRPIGYAAEFSGTGVMIVPGSKIPGVYSKITNYAVSFFVSASSTGTTSQTVIARGDRNIPYDIRILPNKKIAFYVHTGNAADVTVNYVDPLKTTNLVVTSSTAVSSSWNHVVCQKSGSYMQIYVNGSLQANVNQTALTVPRSPSTQSIKIDSTADMYIGGWNIVNAIPYNYTGKLDEIRIYNKALTSTEVGYLGNRSETGSMLQTNVVGNVFAKQGIAVISSPNYLYHNILQTPYTASYKSTLTKYELSTLVRIDAGEYNLSLNSTLLQDDGVSYHGYVSGSDFDPYITTIGLYDDFGQLLAIGKLAQPVKKRQDIDINFLLRMDLDKNIILGGVE